MSIEALKSELEAEYQGGGKGYGIGDVPRAFPGAPVRDSMEKTIARWLIEEYPQVAQDVARFRAGDFDLRGLAIELRVAANGLCDAIPSDALSSFAREAVRFADFLRVANFVREMWTADDQSRMEQEQDRQAFPDVLTMNDDELTSAAIELPHGDKFRTVVREITRRVIERSKGPNADEREAIEEQSAAEDAAARQDFGHGPGQHDGDGFAN
jgi:hypothetical protein